LFVLGYGKGYLFKQDRIISRQSSSGILLRSKAFERPCVPVADPRGAAVWQGAPFLQTGFGFQAWLLVQISVGFILSSPYWQ